MNKQLSIGDLLTVDSPFLAVAVKKQEKKRAKESPEDAFDFQLRAHKLPPFQRQVLFAKQALGRRWQFDFANSQYMIAIEIEGLVVMKLNGQFVVRGRHASITGMREDMVKYNSATQLGWQLLRFEQQMVKSGEAIDTTMRVLHAKGWRRDAGQI